MDTVEDQVAALQKAVYGHLTPHDPTMSPYSITLEHDGRVVAALDVLSKQIEHAGQAWSAAGLSRVLTDPSRRHRGYGVQLVAKAREHLRQLPIDLVVFTCDTELTGFYESAGFELLPGTVLVGGTPQAPFPSDAPGFDKVTMASFVSDRARAAHGDFVGARIALYPGELDRLW